MAERIPLLSPEAARAAALEVDMPEAMAELNVFRALLHELVIMRIGWKRAADYEWTQHWRIALEQFDVPEADLLAVRDWQRADCFGPADRAVLAATDETLEHGRISQETWAACAVHLDAAELVDLVAAIGTWGLIAQVVHSLEVRLEEGVSSWPPDGRAPA
jgi:alkylhydroperoxidase family enzyme